MQWLYLAVNLGAVSVPFLFSFHAKIRFYKQWLALAVAIFSTAAFFLVWDNIFTGLGVWGFSNDYILGIRFGHLPLEEVLFFICIPYACTFTAFCLQQLFWTGKFTKPLPAFTTVVAVGLLIVGILFNQKLYTFYTFLFTALFLFFMRNRLRVADYYTYLILLIPFFIVNGILTGTGIDSEVVWYNDNENLGIRMLTIPVEDTIYGMLLILSNIAIFRAVSNQLQFRSTSIQPVL